jgi:hypothetical protein
MNPPTGGFTPVPNTNLASSIVHGPITTVTSTETVYKTLGAAVDNVASSAASVSLNGLTTSAPTMASNSLTTSAPVAPTSKLTNQLVHMFHKSAKNAGPRWDLVRVAPALKLLVGVAVFSGVTCMGYQLRALKNAVPPGQDPRTWKETVNYAYIYTKAAVNSNHELRTGLAEAHEGVLRERAQAEAARAQKAEMEERFSVAKGDAESLQRKLSDAEKRIRSLEGGAELAATLAQVKELKKELAEALAQGEELKKSLAAEESDSDQTVAEMVALQQLVASRDEELRASKANSDKQEKDLEEANQRAEQLQKELDQQKKDFEDAQRTIKEQQDANQKLTSDLKKMRDELTRVEDEAQAEVDGHEDLQKETEKLHQDALEEEKTKRTEVEQELEALKTQLKDTNTPPASEQSAKPLPNQDATPVGTQDSAPSEESAPPSGKSAKSTRVLTVPSSGSSSKVSGQQKGVYLADLMGSTEPKHPELSQETIGRTRPVPARHAFQEEALMWIRGQRRR